jgi:adenylosuccinate lyase
LYHQYSANMANTTNTTDSALDLQSQISAMKSQNGATIFDSYQTSLTGRYCSAEMSQLFSQRSRHSTWRKLWLYLAEAEKELGIETISEEALQEMRAHLMVTDADFEIARVEEKKRRHDVMAHVHAFGQVAPKAAGIIHYGVSWAALCVGGRRRITCGYTSRRHGAN